MYPRINELLRELHRRKISTFLVTNAQHPDAIDTLIPITQLYVSVDAPTPASLDAIDRPLFNDAWERLKRSLTLLKKKGQRTVARLTIVKGWNTDEIDGYADLITLGHCSFIEVKGVTFCGTSDASNLNMSNSPWHHEVVEFTEKLKKRLNVLHERHIAGGGSEATAPPRYGLACAHKHSCSVLLAREDQFGILKNGEVIGWKTWMDYEKFQELAAKNEEDGSMFGVMDYLEETPTWAEFGSSAEGFDPTDTRVFKNKKKYQDFDAAGIPTTDHNGVTLSAGERNRCEGEMDEAIKGGATVEIVIKKGGERVAVDPKLMFRGLTV
jgi:tRNA wybutosine-synthesizing protein 1